MSRDPRLEGKRTRSLRQCGFTLVELVVAFAVLAILVTIAYPAYFSQTKRANRSAAQQYMQDLANREEQYRLDARAYTTSKSALGWSSDPPTVSPNYTVAIATTGNNCGGVAVVAPAYVISATPSGSQASDGTLCLDSQGNKTPTAKW